MRTAIKVLQVMGGGGIPWPETVYGVSWNKAATPTLTRTDDSAAFTANAGLDAGVVDNDFDTADIYGDITEVTDAANNVFVRIPKFYILKTDGVGSKTWQISKDPIPGGYLPKCFLSGATELDYIDVGKYPASLDVSGTKLCSLADVFPLVSKTIVEFRTYAEANGAGYQQLDIHVVDILQTLFYVEFATLHSQSIMAGFTAGQYLATHVLTADTSPAGNTLVVANATGALYRVGQTIGCGTALGGGQLFTNRVITAIDADTPGAGSTTITFDGAAVALATNNIIYNMGWKNGFSSGITATSGGIGHLTNGLYPHTYRGIENVWGNIWHFVDGVNINERQAWVCLDAADYASNLFTAPYLQLGYVNHNADGYVSAMGWDANYPFAALPVAVAGGGITKFYSDYYYQTSGQRIALLGGHWYAGVGAGLSYWSFNVSSPGTSSVIGGRLVRKGG